MSDYLHQMKSLHARYQAISKLEDPRDYKIQYSHLHRFPVLALGDNPGGRVDGDLLSASVCYEGWEHDIVYFRDDRKYHIARGYFDVLAAILGTKEPEAVSKVPYLNVTFRRSKDKTELRRKGFTDLAAARESAPVLTKILQLVAPRFIVITNGGFKQFRRIHLRDVTKVDDECITSPIGRTRSGEIKMATIFSKYRGELISTQEVAHIAVIEHPSTFSNRAATWESVAEKTASYFRANGFILQPTMPASSIP